MQSEGTYVPDALLVMTTNCLRYLLITIQASVLPVGGALGPRTPPLLPAAKVQSKVVVRGAQTCARMAALNSLVL